MFTINRDINLAYQIYLKAEKNPDFPIFTFEAPGLPDEVLTYRKLVEKGNRLAGALKSVGIRRGDVFAVVMENRPEIIISLYAALSTGAVMLPLDPGFDSEKLAYLLRHCNVKGILFSADIASTIEKTLVILPEVKVIGVTPHNESRDVRDTRHPDLEDIFNKFDPIEVLQKKAIADDHALILYTSGTTGIPKGNCIKTEQLNNYLAMAAYEFQYTLEDRLYSALPMTHGNTYSMTILPTLVFGIPAVISRYFDTRRIWDICRQYECTIFSLLGDLSIDIYSQPEQSSDAVNPVRKVISAGTPASIWQPIEKRFNVIIHEWYSTLEGGFAHNPPGEGPVGSFGKPENKYVEMKVTGKNNSDCAPDEIGELLFRFIDGKMPVEYLTDPPSHDNSNINGWFRTGDMVHQDQNGWFFFDYRKGHELMHHGQLIAAADVEKVLNDHPQVREVCVYGIDSASGASCENDLVAAITPIKDITPDIKKIFEFCATRLHDAAIPSYIQLVQTIPKTPTEKVIRRLLKEAFEIQSPYVYRLNDYMNKG